MRGPRPGGRVRGLSCLVGLGFIVLGLLFAGVLVLTWRTVAIEKRLAGAFDPEEYQPPPVAPRGDLSGAEQSTIDLFREAAPSVAYITTVDVRRDPFRFNIMEIPRGTGSGFLWDRYGHVVTNYHVIQGASAARVTLADQSVWPARLVGRAAHKDLAVLKIDAPPKGLKALPIGESSNLAVGQHVFAIGNPFGLDHTLSTGVISGLGREIKAATGRPIADVIQTDAAINPGNSGGPLLDSSGRLIGINTAIYSPSGASAGIGFAVPVDTVARIVPQLIQHGREIRPTIGVQIAEAHVAQRLGIKGVLILKVEPDSPAAKAGLQPTLVEPRTGHMRLGDVIVGLEGTEIEAPNDLFRLLDEQRPGKAVRLAIQRDGSKVDVQLTLASN